MHPKPHPPKPTSGKPPRQVRKGTTETSRLFIDVEEAIRHPAPHSLTRYVE